MSTGVYTAINNSLNTCTVTNFNFTDQSGINHVANLTNFAGSAAETGNAVVSSELPAGAGRTFSVYYNTSTIVGGTYLGEIAILATMYDATVETENVANFIYIQTPPPVEPPPTFLIDYFAGGGDGGGGATSGGCDAGAAAGGASCGAGAAGATGGGATDGGTSGPGDGGGDGGGACFLTTAASKVLGISNESYELALVRLLRSKMIKDGSGRSILEAYDFIGPVLSDRVKDWKPFYHNVMKPVAKLVEVKNFDLARKIYISETLTLLDQHIRYTDFALVEKLIEIRFVKYKLLPYFVKYFGLRYYIKYRITQLKKLIEANDLR